LTTKKTEAAKKHNRKLEYFLINIFSFICIGLIALFLLNFSLFDPFKLAFKDFSLTDVYYTSMINKNQIYNGPLVIVNIENKTRAELAFLLEKLQEGRPKVIGVDIIFPDRKDSSDALLKAVFSSYSNFVLPYSLDGKNFQQLNVTPVDGSFLPPWDRSLRVGLIAKGDTGQKVSFDNFQLNNK
jgi:hypothetical protein